MYEYRNGGLDALKDAVNAIVRGEAKIAFIKGIRTETGLALKEAKVVADRFYADIDAAKFDVARKLRLAKAAADADFANDVRIFEAKWNDRAIVAYR